MVVVVDPDSDIWVNSLNILSIRQRIKRRYKEKARLRKLGYWVTQLNNIIAEEQYQLKKD